MMMIENEDSAPAPGPMPHLSSLVSNARSSLQKAAAARSSRIISEELEYLRDFEAVVGNTLPLHPLYPASKSRGERDILELEFDLHDARKRLSEIQRKHPFLSWRCHHSRGGPANHVKRSLASSPEIPNHHPQFSGGIVRGSHVKRSFTSSNELVKPLKKRINLSPPHMHSMNNNINPPSLAPSSPHTPRTARTRSRSPPAYDAKAGLGLYRNEKRSHIIQPRSCSCSPAGTTPSETSTNSDQSTSFRNFKRSMSLNEATSNKYVDKIAHKKNLSSEPACEYPLSSAAEMENEIATEMSGDHLRGKVLYVVDDESNQCPDDSLSGASVALNLWPLMPRRKQVTDDYDDDDDDDDDDDLNFPLLPPGTSKQTEKEREKTEVEARLSGDNGFESMVLPDGPIRRLKSQVEHERGFASSLQIPASSSDDDCASWIAAATCGLKTNSEDNHVSLEEDEGIFSMDEGRDADYSLSHPKIGNTRASSFPQVHVQRRSSPSLRSINNNAKRQEEEQEEDAINALQTRFQELFYSNEENNLYTAKSVKKLKKVDIKDSLKLSENMEKTLECLESSLHDSEGGESLYQEVMNVERRLALKTSSYSFPPEVPSKDIMEEMLKEDRATQQYVSSCAVTSGSRRELFTNDDNGNDGNGDGAERMHQYYPTSCQNKSQSRLPLQHLDDSDCDEVRASESSSKARLQLGKEIQAENLRYDLKLKKKVKFNEGSWNLAKNVELDNHPERCSSSNPPHDQIQPEAGDAEGMNTTFSSLESECDRLGKLQVKDFIDKDIDRYTQRHNDGDVDENVEEPCKKQGLTISRNSFSQDAMSDSSVSSSASCGAKGEPCNKKKSLRSLSDSLGKISPVASDSSLISTSQHHQPFKVLSHEFYHSMGAGSNSKEMTFCNPVFDYDSTLNHQLPDYDNFSRPMFNSRNADDEFKSTVGSTNFLIQGHIDSWLSNNLQTKIKQQVAEAVAESMKKFEESIKIDIGNLKKDIELDLKQKMDREKICERAVAELNLMLEGKLEKQFSVLMETACAGKEKVISEMQSELSALRRDGEGVRAETLGHMETMMNLVEEVKSKLDKESMRCKDDKAVKEELETIRKDGMNCRCILDGLKKEFEAQMSEIKLAIDKIDTESMMQCKDQIGGMQSFEKLLYKEYMDVKKVTKSLEKSWKDSHSDIEKNRLNILKIEKELKDRIDDLEKLWKEAHFNTENDLKNRVGDLQKSCKQGEYDVESLKEFIADVKKGRSMWNREAELKHVVQTLEKSFKQGFSDLEALKKFKDDVETGRRSFLNSEVATRQGTLMMERVESLSQLYLGGLDEVRTQIQDLKSQVQARFNELERHVKVSKQKREEPMQTTSPQSLQTRILELQQGHIFTQSLEDNLEDVIKKKSGKLQDGLNFNKDTSSVQLEVMKMCEDINREKEAALGAATTAKKKINKVVQEFENELERLHITQSKAEKETDSIRHLSEEISSFSMKAKYVLHDMTELRQKTLRLSDEVLSELTQTKWKNASTNHRCDDMYKKVLSLEGSQLDLSSKLDEFLDKMEGLEKSVAEWVPKYDAAARVLNEVENRLGMLETSSTHDVNIEKRLSDLVDKDPFVSYYKHMSTKINSDEGRWSPLEANRSLTNLDTRERGVGMSVDTRIIIVESRIEHVASATYTNLRILDTKVQHINGNVETALKCATMAEKKCKILGAELVKVFRMLANSAKPYPGKRHVSPSRGGSGGDSEHHHHLPKTEAFRIRKKSPLSRVQLSQKKHLSIVENKHSDGRSIKVSERNDDRNRVALNKNEAFGTNSSTRKFTTPKAGANSQPCPTSVQGNSVDARSNKKAYNMASRNVNVLDSEDSWPASESISVKLKHRDQGLSKTCVGSSAASNPESINSHSSPVKNSQRTDFHMVSGRIHVNEE